MSPRPAFLLVFLIILLPTLLQALPSITPSPSLTPSELYQYLPPNLQPPPPNSNLSQPSFPLSTCTRSYWKGTWTAEIWIRNKTTPEYSSTTGQGFYDNVNHDCNGVLMSKNPIPLSENTTTGRITGYYVAVGVEHGEGYAGCVEEAIRQAEEQTVVCEVVASPCHADAAICRVEAGGG